MVLRPFNAFSNYVADAFQSFFERSNTNETAHPVSRRITDLLPGFWLLETVDGPPYECRSGTHSFLSRSSPLVGQVPWSWQWHFGRRTTEDRLPHRVRRDKWPKVCSEISDRCYWNEQTTSKKGKNFFFYEKQNSFSDVINGDILDATNPEPPRFNTACKTADTICVSGMRLSKRFITNSQVASRLRYLAVCGVFDWSEDTLFAKNEECLHRLWGMHSALHCIALMRNKNLSLNHMPSAIRCWNRTDIFIWKLILTKARLRTTISNWLSRQATQKPSPLIFWTAETSFIWNRANGS